MFLSIFSEIEILTHGDQKKKVFAGSSVTSTGQKENLSRETQDTYSKEH